MTVGELRDELANLPSDLEVIIQMDHEGNGYRSAYCVDLAVDDEDNGYPPVADISGHYEVDEEVPSGKVVVIV